MSAAPRDHAGTASCTTCRRTLPVSELRECSDCWEELYCRFCRLDAAGMDGEIILTLCWGHLCAWRADYWETTPEEVWADLRAEGAVTGDYTAPPEYVITFPEGVSA